jgi:hypothetical protein
MWHIDPFLGNNLETNKTAVVAMQQILNKQQLNYSNRGTVGNGVFYLVHAKGLYNEDTSLGAQLLLESQSVKRRLSKAAEESPLLVCYQGKPREDREDYVCCSYSDIWNV